MTLWLGLALVLVWGLAVVFFRVNRIWLLYYLTGSIGLAFIIIFVGRATPLQGFLESGVATSTFLMANLMGISARLFEAEESSLMIFVVGQLVGHDNGWTMVRVTVECSSLLETGVISGMVGFYPAWSLRKRFVLVALGITAAFVANIIRLGVIIWTLQLFGKDSLFIAHTVIGRAVFFVLIIAIFWYLITLPTMRIVARKLKQDLAT